MCTTLRYVDAGGAAYLGRTLELDVEEPWHVAYVPSGISFRSEVPGHDPVSYTTTRDVVAVVSPAELPAPGEAIGPASFKACEGLNDAGLTFSLLAFPTVPGDDTVHDARTALQATDLGSWILGQFSTVDDVRSALEDQPVFLTPLTIVGGARFPFHAVVHDRSGACIVLEWHKGQAVVHDNPVGVMTNGPTFDWHLTNLGNWTHLTNVDTSSATFGSFTVHQPDSGIATAALPGSNTSVGRFIRAVFYSTFTEKVDDPDRAMLTLARIMNNFDRPRGATTDPSGSGGEGVSFQGSSEKDATSTEYTSWTNLTDLERGRLLLRSYGAFNYTSLDLDLLAAADGVRLLAMDRFDPLGGDGNDALLAAPLRS